MQTDEVFQNRDELIAQQIFALLNSRQPGASICPSEVARALATTEPAWRALMPHVRAVAAQLVELQQLEVTQKGQLLDVVHAHGPIRLRRPLPRGTA